MCIVVGSLVVGEKEAKGFEKFLWERDRCSDNAMEEKGERRRRERGLYKNPGVEPVEKRRILIFGQQVKWVS